jgi:hypothetical protein
MWNKEMDEARQQLVTQVAIQKKTERDLVQHQQATNAVWLQKGPKQNGLNRSKIIQDIREAYQLTVEGDDEDTTKMQSTDVQAVESVAKLIVKEVKQVVQRDLESRHSKLLADWERVSGDQSVFYQ